MSEPVLSFGKHKGCAISEVPVNYLDWLIGQHWLEDDLKFQIEEYLKNDSEWQRM